MNPAPSFYLMAEGRGRGDLMSVNIVEGAG